MNEVKNWKQKWFQTKTKTKKERKKQAEIFFNIQYTPLQIVNGWGQEINVFVHWHKRCGIVSGGQNVWLIIALQWFYELFWNLCIFSVSEMNFYHFS